METDPRVTFTDLDQCSTELATIAKAISNYTASEGVRPEPNDASAYYLLDQVSECEELIREFLQKWKEFDPSDIPNGGNVRLYYLDRLNKKYGERPTQELIEESGILKQFRDIQMRNGRIRVHVNEGPQHGLGFRGIIAVAPMSSVAQKGIKNIKDRFDNNSKDDISPASALGLLEHNYKKYKRIVDEVTEKEIDRINSRHGSYKYNQGLMLVFKNPSYSVRSPERYPRRLYANGRRRSLAEGVELNLGFYSEVGILMLASGDGPAVSRYQSNWKTELSKQQGSDAQFLSTQPATEVDNRKTEIKSRMEIMINNTSDSLYICTRGIGILHHQILDLLEYEQGIDFKLLTNYQRAGGDRKRYKRAAMDELAERTGKGVKQSRMLHTRMVISDQESLLVSNADITRDQLHDSFNAGIYTEDPSSVSKAVEMFEAAWESGEYMEPS